MRRPPRRTLITVLGVTLLLAGICSLPSSVSQALASPSIGVSDFSMETNAHCYVTMFYVRGQILRVFDVARNLPLLFAFRCAIDLLHAYTHQRRDANDLQ